MIQGVREVFDIVDLDGGRGAGKGDGMEEEAGKLVLIGRGLDEEAFGESLRACLDGA